MSDHDIAWGLFIEVRKQILEFQKIRAQLFGFKIALVSAAAGLIVANADRIPMAVLAVPALASIFFDLLIIIHSYSIKRSGKYCEDQLEPTIKERRSSSVPMLWEEYFRVNKPIEQAFSLISNLGITGLVVVPAGIALFHWHLISGLLLSGFLILFYVTDIMYAILLPMTFRPIRKGFAWWLITVLRLNEESKAATWSDEASTES